MKYIYLFFLALSLTVHSQSVERIESVYDWFDSSIGQENSGLYQGVLYYEEYNMINENHRFFESEDFVLGKVVYHGQPYFNAKLKYDLFKDQLLTTPSYASSALVIQLEKEKIEGFSLANRRFIRVDNTIRTGKLGFCEVLKQEANVLLLKKHRKTEKETIKNDIVFNEFLSKNSYYVMRNDSIFSVNSRKEITSFRPSIKKEISDYFKSYASMKDSNYDAFMVLIFERLFSPEYDKRNLLNE